MPFTSSRPRILFALALLFLAAGGAAAADRRIAVRPFEAYNAPDLEAAGPGLQAALASRLAGPGLQVVTLQPGEAVDADWVVRVTLTRVGSRTSVDGSMEPVSGRGTVARAYEIAENAEGLFQAMNAVASKLRREIANAPLPTPAPPSSVTPSRPAAGPASPSPAATASPPPPEARPGDVASSLKNYRTGPTLPVGARAVAAVDVDRDGVGEVLVLTDTEIVAFRDQGTSFDLLWRLAVGKSLQPSYLSAGDIDGDGFPEVFVAGLQAGSVFTEVYQWANGGLARRGAGQVVLLRALVHPERGVVLLGQTSGAGQEGLGKDLRLFAWADGSYRDRGFFPAPDNVLVTDVDWHRLNAGGPVRTVFSTQTDKLRIYEPDGELAYEGNEDVKGSENFLAPGSEVDQDRLEASFFRIQGKTVLVRDSAGTPHLLVQRNHALVTFLKRMRSYSQGQVVAYRWQELGLVPSGESPKVPGYLADLDLGPARSGSGGATLYGLLVQSEGSLASKSKARLLAWDL